MDDRDKTKEQLIEELAELRRSLDALMNNLPEGVLVVDAPDVTVRLASLDACTMIGASREELTGVQGEDHFDYYQVFLPDGEPVQTEQLPLARVIARGEVIRNEEWLFQGMDGGRIPIICHAGPIFDERGMITGAVLSWQDIRERKRAEVALQKAHDELEQRVKERTAELVKEYRNLKRLLRASDHERQTIAYEIHDELAQQLAGSIMQFDAFDHLKETKPKQATDAFHAAMTMLRQGYSETRRLIAGVRPPILDEAGAVQAVDHLVNELRRGKGPKIEFRNSVEFDRLVPVLENAIYRIVQEALTNACQYSKSERISVSLLQRDDRLRIEVRDWGVGFDPQTVPKNRFGLEGIRQRTRLLGGKCSIRSTAGKGTRIAVELPVVPKDEEG